MPDDSSAPRSRGICLLYDANRLAICCSCGEYRIKPSCRSASVGLSVRGRLGSTNRLSIM